jgi:hypothetical protein
MRPAAAPFAPSSRATTTASSTRGCFGENAFHLPQLDAVPANLDLGVLAAEALNTPVRAATGRGLR